jgi:hypothetical protein
MMEVNAFKIKIMEVNEEVRNTLVENLYKACDNLYNLFNDSARRIKMASSVEEIMRIKQNLLYDLFDNHIPLDCEECYFCLLHMDKENAFPDCTVCEYAIFHKCCRETDSDYQQLMNKIEDVQEFVGNKYYGGETFKPVKEITKKSIREKKHIKKEIE